MEDRRPVTRDVAAFAPVDDAPAPVVDAVPDAAAPRRPRTKRPPRRRQRVKILFVAANTQFGDQLALDEEYRAIERSIRLARHRDAFELIPQLAARPGDLQQALLEHSPDVVHFACHGSAEAEILLLGDGAVPGVISAEALASLFRVLQDNLVLVVFNACFASGPASAIRQHAGLAIGMRERIEDRVAMAFASALYGALAYGRSVRDAFDLAVAAVEVADARQRHVPQLFLGSGIEAEAIRLIERARAPRAVWAISLMALCAALAVAWHAWQPPAEPGHGAPEARQPGAAAVVREEAHPHAYPSPPPGMLRFAATSVRPGVFSGTQRPAACAAHAADDCAELAHPDQVAAVALPAFDLDALEVTNGDYARWLMRRPDLWTVTPKGIVTTRQEPGVSLLLVSERCGGGLSAVAGDRVVASLDKASWPVVCVTWHGASEYCRTQHKRLPLEAEWELAAKGRDGRPFPWGADLPRQDGVAFDLRDGASAHPRDVGSSTQDVSPDGVRDLGGNVAEWVEDGRGISDQKTIRGGSWASRGPCHVLGSSCKRITLDAIGPYGPDVGFRCASSVMEER
jgi:formylglycine-generating enzyme required for sulfatase activity